MILKSYLFTLLTLLIFTTINTIKPAPKCQPKFFYQTLPMIPDQSAILNLDRLFDGYNLNFQLSGSSEWSKYITLNEKLKLQKKQIPDTPMVGLKSYHLEKINNGWGTSFVAMSERGERTYLSFGFLASNTSAPVINNDVRVQNFTNTTCFDAVAFPKQGVIIVDCVAKFATPNQQGFYYQNEFYYFRISDGQKIKTIQNQMFIPFTSITRRKMQIYTEKISGNTYLLRSYMYDGVDQQHQTNTYIDVHMVTKPLQPWIVSVIDRSFLGSSILRATDIKVYLSEIYVLDYSKGVYRIKINTEEDLIYTGFYQAKGFSRFAVYSNNLDDKFQLALANDHKVYEIDWSHIDDPILLTKYSLMPNSNIRQVFLNQRFLVVLSSSSVDTTVYHYTWILSRNDRTYTKAFQVMKHQTVNVFVDLNLQESYLMVMDDQKIANYAIDQAIMTLTLKRDEQMMDRIMQFQIIAKSVEPTTGLSQQCSFLFNFTQVEENNRTMWPIGYEPTPNYNANYPGKIELPLYSYVIGPNITYRVTEVNKGQLKNHKIYQQDQLQITWQKKLPMTDLIFLRTQTINRAHKDILLLYTQDSSNKTFVSICLPDHKSVYLICNQSNQLTTQGTINNWATTNFVHSNTLIWHHIASYTTSKHYNKVYVDDISTKQKIMELEFEKGFEGNVTNVQTYGKYMFIIKQYVKTILIYDLELFVQDFDQPICSITHTMLYDLGIKYFSPELIQTSNFYPNVLFIKTSDSIIVLDLNTQCSPKLLSVLKPVESTLIQFSFMLTASHLVVTAMPNSIIEYDLSRVYLKDIKKTKKYPLYGYKLPKNYDTDVSEYGNLMFVTTISEGGDYQVFVYRAGHPGVASLYDVIDLYTYQPILIDASGNAIDYVAVWSAGTGEIRIFRQYETPIAQIQNPQKNYQFWLQYYNVVTSIKLELISVSIINLPTKIAVNPKLNDIMQTKDLLYSGFQKISEINDTYWYQGNVLTIKTDCKDCDKKVIVRNHIHKQSEHQIIPAMVDYEWTQSGGSILGYNYIMQIKHDGNVRDFIHLPQITNSICITATAPLHSKYQVSACMEGQGINLYLTSLLSHKGFAFAPYSSRAQQLLKVQAVHELIILLDTSTNPFKKTRAGGVILYALNFDMDQDEAFEEIEYIDSTDLTNDDKPLYIVNAQLFYHSQTNTYRLYITEITKGMYQLTIKYNSNLKGITILHVTKMDLPSILEKSGYKPPYDATYQAVKVIQSTYDAKTQKSTDLVIVTTGVYHNIMFEIIYDSTWVVTGISIKKIFLRYAYYVVENSIKYTNGLIVLRQTLPEEYDTNSTINNNTNKSKQIITVYDIHSLPFTPVPPEKIPQVGLIGAEMFNDRHERSFDFNLTFNRSDPHPQPRINLAILQQFTNMIDQMSLHRNLTVYTEDTVDTQIIYLDLINDFDIKKIRILLNGWSPYPEWKLITIILFSIIGGLMLIATIFVAFKKYQAYKMGYSPSDEQPERRQSLLTEQKATERHSTYSQSSDKGKNKQSKYEQSNARKQNKYDNYSNSGRYDSSYGDKYDSGRRDSMSNKYDSGSSSYDSGYGGGYSGGYGGKYEDSYGKYDSKYDSKYDNKYDNKSDYKNENKTENKYSSKYESKYESKYDSKYDSKDKSYGKYDKQDSGFSYS